MEDESCSKRRSRPRAYSRFYGAIVRRKRVLEGEPTAAVFARSDLELCKREFCGEARIFWSRRASALLRSTARFSFGALSENARAIF